MKIKKILKIKTTDSSEGEILAAEWESQRKKEKIFQKIKTKYEYLSEGVNPFDGGKYEICFLSKKYFYVVVIDDIEEE